MVLLSGAAWGGVAWLLVNVSPAKPLATTVFYVFAFVGVASAAASIAWLALRPRSPLGRLESPARYLGHSMLLAVVVLFALWLQSLRMLTMPVALLLSGLYLFLELALLFGTRGSVDVEVRSRARVARERMS